MLKDGDPRATLERLMEVRYPVYALADHVVDTANEAHEAVVMRLIELLRAQRA